MTRRSVQILLAAAAFGAAPAFAQTGLQTASSAGAVPTSDVPALTATLYDPASPADQREQAAQRLLARPGTAARGTLQAALSAFRQPAVQLAAARALAARPTDDATLVAPLFDLFTPSSGVELIDAAGRALTAYKHNDTVIDRLIGLTATGDERVRLAAINAVGTFVDKKAAAALVPLIEPAAQPSSVPAAASSALSYLSGQSASTDAAGWRAWWASNSGKSDGQFEADLARDRAARYDRVRTRVDELESEFGRTLADLYQRTPAEQRADVLVHYLRSTEPSVRTAAAGIARQRAVKENTPEPVKAQLRLLIGDASPAVRREAVSALAPQVDAVDVVPLLTQLNQETDTTVRAALADALRPTLAQDSRGVPALLLLLDDESPATAQAAAEALAEGGARLRQNDPAAADRAAEKIVQVLPRTSAQNNVELRAALIAAIAPLQSPGVAGTLLGMLNSQAEDKRVRRALLVALGNYHNSRFTDAIAVWIRDKNDVDTRRAAIYALEQSATSFGDVDRPLTDRLDPKNEPQADVRDAAWKVLAGLFSKATGEQLSVWESKLRGDPAKLLVVLREQRERARRAGQNELLADKNSQIGEASLAAGLYADATTAYVDAIAYARANNNNRRDVQRISEGLTKAYLRNHQYAQAIDFVQQQIRQSSVYQDTLGSEIKLEAERLVEEMKEYDSALQLIDLSLKMEPKLARKHTEQLEQLRAQVNNRYRQQNQSPFRQGAPVESAMRTGRPTAVRI